MSVKSKSRQPIYIDSLKMRNLRTFKGDVEVLFAKADGSLSQWTLILGDNGIGKSTLLQSIAWMKPDLQDTTGIGMSLTKEKIEPFINNETNESLERLVRKDMDSSDFTSIEAKYISGVSLNKAQKRSESSWCSTKMEISLNENRKLEEVTPGFDTTNEEIFLKNEVHIFGYSASRVLGKANIGDAGIEDSLSSFLADNTILYDAEQILHTIHYAALGAPSEREKKRYFNYLNVVKEALVSLLPDFENVKSIEISSPRFINNVLQDAVLAITTKHGDKLPFGDFSLGYKTVMSWVIDLSWRLFNAYPDSKTPLNEAAIVLIDELDLHLHPVWQREIIRNLSLHFPNVQFIATAHSPLMVQAALQENYAVLKFYEEERCVKIINDLKAIDGWRIDQILTSDFFGLKTARGLEYEELFNRRQELLRKKKLGAEDKKEISLLAEKLSNFPIGETEDEIENRRVIAEAIQKIKAKNKVIEI